MNHENTFTNPELSSGISKTSENHKKNRRRQVLTRLHIAGLVCAVITGILWICANRILFFGEYYALRIYPVLVRVVGGLFSLIPFSVAEVLMYLCIFLIPTTLIRRVYRIIRGKDSWWRSLLEYVGNLLSAAAILLMIFMLGGGINYYRIPFSLRERLSIENVERGELEAFCQEMVDAVNREVLNLAQEADPVKYPETAAFYSMDEVMGAQQAEEGFLANAKGSDADKVVSDGSDRIQRSDKTYKPSDWLSIYAEERSRDWQEVSRQSIAVRGEEFSSLRGFYPTPKPLLNSRFLSVQQVTGIYSPFTMEANYNQEIPGYEMPFTICHELSHLKGFMREDEANFIAWLACFYSEDSYLRYSGALEGFLYAGNALFKYDREKYYSYRKQLCPEAEMDLQYGYAFWHRFDGPVAETHEKINDAYLKANNQKDGVESYGRVVNLMVGYMREQGK